LAIHALRDSLKLLYCLPGLYITCKFKRIKPAERPPGKLRQKVWLALLPKALRTPLQIQAEVIVVVERTRSRRESFKFALGNTIHGCFSTFLRLEAMLGRCQECCRLVRCPAPSYAQLSRHLQHAIISYPSQRSDLLALGLGPIREPQWRLPPLLCKHFRCGSVVQLRGHYQSSDSGNWRCTRLQNHGRTFAYL